VGEHLVSGPHRLRARRSRGDDAGGPPAGLDAALDGEDPAQRRGAPEEPVARLEVPGAGVERQRGTGDRA
jgi:hypothetical protein